MKSYLTITLLIIILVSSFNPKSLPQEQIINTESNTKIYLPLVIHSEMAWTMAGGNPERTSWTAGEIRGILRPLWYRPIEPYILPRTQIITSYGMLYLSTSAGLFAIDADTGNEVWFYPTAMPLGHSPTIQDGVAYVGGFDHKLHAIDAFSGQGLWTFKAGAGFDANPLVIDGKVYIGSRDGYFYSIYAEGSDKGKLAWKYKTGGPIHFSAAYKDGAVYFASDDSHAYALSSNNGALIWKSDKLPGAGFHSWWPVVYQDWVIFAGSHNYHETWKLGPGSMRYILMEGVYPNRSSDPKGTLVGKLGKGGGNWAAGTVTIDASKPETTANGGTVAITEYHEQFPWRRTYFVLNRMTGSEYTTDFDQDGKVEYAPILWFGNEGTENRYPPIVGQDGILYQTNNYMSDRYIPGGHITGWQIGTPFISIIYSSWSAMDEPIAFSGGGNLIYWNKCCDRAAGAVDISTPNTVFYDRYLAGYRPPTGGSSQDRQWVYFNYNLPDIVPDYNTMTYVYNPYYRPEGGNYGGRNSSYGWHGDVNPPIPYQGKVFMHRSNAILAFSPQSGSASRLALLQPSDSQNSGYPSKSKSELVSLLNSEVQKIVNAGHLRPGYLSSGLFDTRGRDVCGDDLVEYWHHPGDLIYTLTLALPHLSTDLQQATRTYLMQEFSTYPPYQYNHIGFRDGVGREAFDLPPDVDSDRINYPPSSSNNFYDGWHFAPNSLYALWKYAETFGGATSIFNASKTKLESAPSNDYLMEMPHVHNAYIAGYYGYLELEELAGYPESANIRSELNRLLNLRVTTFSKDTSDAYFQDSLKGYCRALNASRNFMYLVPELSQSLHDNAHGKVAEALEEYQQNAPYWFVTKAEVAYGEAVTQHLYEHHAIFQAKAQILKESQEELGKYFDIPAFAIGDLFYIQNLISAIEADSQ